MPQIERPRVLSTRVRPRERAEVRALAELEGTTVCELMHRLLMPEVRRRLVELATARPEAA
jgi:hypothetical protein